MNNLPELSRGGSVCDDIHAFLADLQSSKRPELRPVATASSFVALNGTVSVEFSATFPEKLVLSSYRSFNNPAGNEKYVKVETLCILAAEILGEWILKNRAFSYLEDSDFNINTACRSGVSRILLGDEQVTESFQIEFVGGKLLTGHEIKIDMSDSIPEHLAIRNALKQVISPSVLINSRLGWHQIKAM